MTCNSHSELDSLLFRTNFVTSVYLTSAISQAYISTNEINLIGHALRFFCHIIVNVNIFSSWLLLEPPPTQWHNRKDITNNECSVYQDLGRHTSLLRKMFTFHIKTLFICSKFLTCSLFSTLYILHKSVNNRVNNNIKHKLNKNTDRHRLAKITPVTPKMWNNSKIFRFPKRRRCLCMFHSNEN